MFPAYIASMYIPTYLATLYNYVKVVLSFHDFVFKIENGHCAWITTPFKPNSSLKHKASNSRAPQSKSKHA